MCPQVMDLSRLLVGAPYDLREALAMTESLVRSGGLSALVFDALEILWTDPNAARYLAAFLDRLAAPLAHSGTVVLAENEHPFGSQPEKVWNRW